MARGRHAKRERTEDWGQIQQYCLWDEQVLYESLRPCLVFQESAEERARETGIPARTISRKVKQFREQGMVSLFDQEQVPTPDPERTVPEELRQFIVNVHAQHPPLHLREIAQMCYLRFGRQPNHHTIQRVLNSGLAPTVTERRYPLYSDMPDPYQRRKAIVDLHAEGWNIKSIAMYLGTTRQRVYDVLKRWVREGHAGLDDRSRAPHEHAHKVTFAAITEVRRIAVSTPELGAYRVRARLEQLDIHLSQATCGRLLALNRRLYGLPADKEKEDPKLRKEMPYKARFRHEWWSVDIRYIEHHGISEIVYCNQAMNAYQMLSIHKERIEYKQAWQNYSETTFNISRRMGDAKYERAATWSEALRIHREWVSDYNQQRHWAHEKRTDGCHSPTAVLDWHKGQMYPPAVLNRILFATHYTRRLDRHGYIRLHKWRFCGEAGLARQPVTVWIYDGQLKVKYEAVTLAEYQVDLEKKTHQISRVNGGRVIDTPFRSTQLALFDLDDGWLLYLPARERVPYQHRRRDPNIEQLPLPDFLLPEGVEPLWREQPPRTPLRLVDSGSV